MAANGKNSRSTTRRRGRIVARPSQHRTGMPALVKLAAVIGSLAFICLIGLFAGALFVYKTYTDELVAPDELAINQPSYGAKILDRNGKLLYEYVDDRSGLRRPVHLGDISEAFLATTISTEDDSFFTNPGVNLNGLLRAAWGNSPIGNKSRYNGGGSSITEQLVKNVYIPEADRQKRLISRKVKETLFAVELTHRYSKEQILEWYVNQIAYGGVYNGVEAASQGYFGKSAKDLTLAEAALLAGIPQSPSAYDPVNNPDAAMARRNEVLDLMERQGGHIQVSKDKYFDATADQIEAAKAEPVSIAVKRFPIEAPHFVLEYIQPELEQMFGHDALYREGLVVTTTLDLDLQEKAQANMEQRISQYEYTGLHNGAMVIIDPKTGEILTMVGSRDYFREDIDGKVNNATALNSPGSSFKPFVYAMAFQKLGWGPGTIALDTPVSYKQADGSFFSPTNPTHTYNGPITLRNALGNSLNVVAEKTAAATGIDYIVQWSRKFGFTTVNGSYGPAIATGGVDLTPLEMTYSYTVLANGGIMRGQTPLAPHKTNERTLDPISVLKVTDAQGRERWNIDQHRSEQRIIPAEYTYLVTDILTDGGSQCITFGCGGITIPGYKAAVKTGTSQPFDQKGPNADKVGETWAFGYTPDIVVSIWAGNSDNSPISLSLLSTSAAFPAMRDTLVGWYGGRPQTAFARPEGVVSQAVCVPSGLLPSPLCGRTTTDLFAKGSLPKTQDTWWQVVAIDGRTNLLASPFTPPQYVEQRVMLVFPPDMTKTEEDRKANQEWASALGLAIAPTDVTPANANGGFFLPGTGAQPGLVPGAAGGSLPAMILSPTPGQPITGPVQVTGVALSSNFVYYRLEYGSGASPANWVPISQNTVPVSSGPLGVWNPAGLPPGTYSIRLIVGDALRGQITASVTVELAGPGGAVPSTTALPPQTAAH